MYNPKRNRKFEYLSELIIYMENRQCKTCKFRSDREDFEMCLEVENAILLEDGSIPEFDELPGGEVSCTKWQFGFPDYDRYEND